MENNPIFNSIANDYGTLHGHVPIRSLSTLNVGTVKFDAPDAPLAAPTG